jgi:hypothetical protein
MRILRRNLNLKRLSYKGRTVDALALGADEGRGERRYASGSCKHALIRGFPNGGTHCL